MGCVRTIFQSPNSKKGNSDEAESRRGGGGGDANGCTDTRLDEGGIVQKLEGGRTTAKYT